MMMMTIILVETAATPAENLSAMECPPSHHNPLTKDNHTPLKSVGYSTKAITIKATAWGLQALFVIVVTLSESPSLFFLQN
jgi:hypothetical protein